MPISKVAKLDKKAGILHKREFDVMKNFSLWAYKTVIRRVLHLCFIFIYSYPLLVTQAQQGGTQSGLHNSQYYLQVDTIIDSNTLANQVCSHEPNDCSLRGAISKANQFPENEYLIELPSGVYNLLLPGAEEHNNTTGDLDIYGQVTMSGAAAATTQIDGNALDRVLQVHNAATVTLQDLTITDGLTPPGVWGGGIYNQGNLTITQSVISGNSTGTGLIGEDGNPSGDGGNGGGIYNTGRLLLQDSQIEDNSAGPGGKGITVDCWGDPEGNGGNGGHGGAIFNAGFLTVIQTKISGNITGTGGASGGIRDQDWWCQEGYPGAAGDGGGIYSTKPLYIEDSEITENSTESGIRGGSGGGIYSTSTLYIEDSEITENSTGPGSRYRGGVGGGIYIGAGNATMVHSQVNFNTTGDGGEGNCHRGGCDPGGPSGLGGGIYNDQGVVILDDVIVMRNVTGKGGTGAEGGSGGGIYNKNRITINSCIIEANRTGKGGREMTYPYSPAQPGGKGGGIFNEGELLIIYSQIDGNKTGDGGDDTLECISGGSGGGVFNQGTAQITHSQVFDNITGNSSECDPLGEYSGQGGFGGGIYNSSELSLEYSSIISNTTGDGFPQMNSGNGGGIFSDGELFLNGVSISDNRIGQNGTGGFGGGAYLAGESSIAIHNSLIADNHIAPAGLGSGIFADTVNLNLWHTTLVRNTGGEGSGLHTLDATARLTNTILVSHTVGIAATAGSVVSLNYTLWGSGSWANLMDWLGSITNANSLTGTPAFVNSDLGDYHLGSSSDARDQGIQSIVTTDIDNQPRPNPDTNLPDLGADEYWTPTPISAVDITAPISGTTYASIPFTATVTPTTFTPNIYYVWMPSPATGQGTSAVTYFWHDAGQKTVQVTALNAYGSVQAVQEIPIFTAFKVFMPNIYSSR